LPDVHSAPLGQLKLVKQSRIEKFPADGHPIFLTSLTVKGGDLIGIFTIEGLPAGYPSVIKKNSSWVFNCGLDLGDLVGTDTGCDLGPLKGNLVDAKVTLTKL
jgi:hypothetical protein